MHKVARWFALSALVIVLDQWSKTYFNSAYQYGEIREVIPGLLNFVLAYNPGAAFSFGEGSTWVFALVAVAGWLLLNRTTYGRRTLAVGGNPEAARLAAILPSPRRYQAADPGPYVRRRAGRIQIGVIAGLIGDMRSMQDGTAPCRRLPWGMAAMIGE